MLSFGKRPRELAWHHAGPMLFGDWGTSRLYVLGIAFTATGHGSLFYIALMGVVLLVVAGAYTVICRVYPEGGGVYQAARERAPVLGVIGGLLLFADYVVTAALSSLEAFHYLGAGRAEWWAVGSILVLGAVHFFGPKKAGVLALWIAGGAFLCYLAIAAFAVPHLAAANVFVPQVPLNEHWTRLVHIVLALSGVEAVANMTGIMVPPLRRTVRWTIWPVALEVVALNLVFGLAMNALPEARLEGRTTDMLRALATAYVGPWFASATSVVFALLLLSASSTAITGMLGTLFAMSRDGELPRGLSRLNRFGVPTPALLLATCVPVVVLVAERDLEGLAALYAIGVVGAISINCLSTCRTRRHGVSLLERRGLLGVGLFMAAAWVTIAVEKPKAILFASIVLGAGLLARGAFKRYREVARPVGRIPFPAEAPRILVATRGDTWPVDQGLARAAEIGAACVVALIREASFLIGAVDTKALDPATDPEAARLLDYARRAAQDRNIPLRTVYELSTAPMSVIADHAVTLGVAEVHVGGSRRSRLEKIARGSPLEELRANLPEEVRMVVHRPPQAGKPGAP